MKLTAYVVSAADGRLLLGAVELPDLRATSRTVDDMADAVKAEAAHLTGRSPDDINVEMLF